MNLNLIKNIAIMLIPLFICISCSKRSMTPEQMMELPGAKMLGKTAEDILNTFGMPDSYSSYRGSKNEKEISIKWVDKKWDEEHTLTCSLDGSWTFNYYIYQEVVNWDRIVPLMPDMFIPIVEVEFMTLPGLVMTTKHSSQDIANDKSILSRKLIYYAHVTFPNEMAIEEIDRRYGDGYEIITDENLKLLRYHVDKPIYNSPIDIAGSDGFKVDFLLTKAVKKENRNQEVAYGYTIAYAKK